MKAKAKYAMMVLFAVVYFLVVAQTSTIRVSAEGEQLSYGGYTFTVDALGNATIVKYSGIDSAIVIPETLTVDDVQYPVVAIGDFAFTEMSITSVVIPGSVETIGAEAFFWCRSLTSVTFAQNGKLHTIGDQAFKATAITSVEIPASVKILESEAFSSCNSLSQVTFAEGSQLETLSNYAFYVCPNLTSIKIPASTVTMESFVFAYCSRLTQVIFEENSRLSAIGNSAFKECGIKSVKIPAGVTIIKGSAFEDCTGLTDVSFEKGSKLESIGTSAFAGTSITNIEIPSEVKILYSWAFEFCSFLETIEIAEGSMLNVIGAKCFLGTKINRLVIPPTVEKVGWDLFDACANGIQIYYPANLASSMEDALNGCVCQAQASYTVSDNSVSIVYESVAEDATELNVPAHISGIEVTQISQVGGKNFTYPNSDMSVDNTIKFASELTLPDGWSFSEAERSKKLTPGACTKLTAQYKGTDSLYRCQLLIKVTRAACEEDATLLYTGEGEKEPTCAQEGKAHTECKICGDTVRTIVLQTNENHQWNNGFITTPATYTAKGVKTYTCRLCHQTKNQEIPELTMPEEKKEDESTGENKGQEGEKEKEEGEKEEITQDPPATGKILKGKNAIYKVCVSSREKGTVEFVSPIDAEAASVIIPATINIDGITYRVISIKANAFKNNKKLTKMKIGNNVRTIGKNAFYGCSKLKTITMGKNIETFGSKAFYKCTQITKITIPSKVKKIGKQAFYGCKKLKTITIKTTKLNQNVVGKQAFKGTSKQAKVKVPKSKVKEYKSMLRKKGISKSARITK